MPAPSENQRRKIKIFQQNFLIFLSLPKTFASKHRQKKNKTPLKNKKKEGEECRRRRYRHKSSPWIACKWEWRYRRRERPRQQQKDCRDPEQPFGGKWQPQSRKPPPEKPAPLAVASSPMLSLHGSAFSLPSSPSVVFPTTFLALRLGQTQTKCSRKFVFLFFLSRERYELRSRSLIYLTLYRRRLCTRD